MTAGRDSGFGLPKVLTERFPDAQSILGVFAVIVSLIYSWTLITSFYKVPSWLLFLTLGQILSIYAYSFSLDLIESALILMGILLLEFTIFFPLKNKEEFQSRSIVMVFLLLVSSGARLLIYKSLESSEAFINSERLWWVLTLALGAPFAIMMSKNKALRTVLESIAERTMILLYVYMPISFLALLVVLARNIN